MWSGLVMRRMMRTLRGPAVKKEGMRGRGRRARGIKGKGRVENRRRSRSRRGKSRWRWMGRHQHQALGRRLPQPRVLPSSIRGQPKHPSLQCAPAASVLPGPVVVRLHLVNLLNQRVVQHLGKLLISSKAMKPSLLPRLRRRCQRMERRGLMRM
jgi:hypothetical protein